MSFLLTHFPNVQYIRQSSSGVYPPCGEAHERQSDPHEKTLPTSHDPHPDVVIWLVNSVGTRTEILSR